MLSYQHNLIITHTTPPPHPITSTPPPHPITNTLPCTPPPLQPSVVAEGTSDADSSSSAGEGGQDEISATFEQLVLQFTHIIKRVSKTYGLHESHRQVIILQLKGFLDEFCNTKGSKKRSIKRRYSQVPAVRGRGQ